VRVQAPRLPARKTPGAGHRGAWLLLLLGATIAITGLVLEIHLLPRALQSGEAPLAQTAAPGSMEPGRLGAVLERVAPRLDEGLRGKLADAVLLEATRNGYDPLFLLALVGVESRWRLSAESERGARGLLQLKPSTFAWISAREPDVGGESLETGDDPVVDVRLAIRYFSWLERKFHSRDAALMAYNAGPRRTRQHLRSGDVPDTLRAYPQRVRREYERLLGLERLGRDLSGALARAP